MNPEGRFTFLVLRPVNDMVLWLWRLERRAEFLYRPQFLHVSGADRRAIAL